MDRGYNHASQLWVADLLYVYFPFIYYFYKYTDHEACHRAKLLARLIRADGRMMGYTDIGLRAFGGWAGAGINLL